MDVELSADFKNQVSRLRLDRSSYLGGKGHSTSRYAERPKKQTMPVKMSSFLPKEVFLPKDVEPDADPVSPGNDSPNEVMHSHLWGSAKSKPKQTVSMQVHSAEERRVICKDESPQQEKAPDSVLDSMDSLSYSIQKKMELLEEPDDNYLVPPGWSTDESIGTVKEDLMKSLEMDNPKGKDIDDCQLDSVSREADSIETVDDLNTRIHKKIKDLDEPCNHRAPPGWGSRDNIGPRQPVQESGAGASANVMPSESYAKHQPHSTSSSLSYAVCASDMEVQLRPEDYSDMPLRLRVPNADIFLITSDEDKFCGKHLKDLMEEVEFQLNEDEKTMCKVYLWDDMDHKSSIIDCITEAQEMCTYVFILLTKNFCNDKFADYQKDDTLVRSVTTETRRWGIVPLYTQPKRGAPKEKAYKIPNGLISFKGLDMSRLMKDKDNVEVLEHLNDGDVYFRRGLVSMLEARVHERIRREAIRMQDRHVWIESKKILRRREILLEQNRTRLEMDREHRSLQRQLESLPKELPLSPPSPVDFSPEPIFKREKERTTQRPADSNGRSDGPSTGPSQPHIPAPGQPMGYPPMVFSPQQQHMMNQTIQQQMFAMLGMHLPGQQQSPVQPPFPYMGQPQPPYPNPYQAYIPPQPAMLPPQPPQPTMAPPQPQQPVDTSTQGTPAVLNYYIHAGGNVQVGSHATMVSQEPSATAGYEDDADALERKYNYDTPIEEEMKFTEPPDPGSDHHRDWYAEPKKPPDEKPPEEHPYLRPPNPSIMVTKGRRSPVESQSPQLPEKLPRMNLYPDKPSSSYYSTNFDSNTSRIGQQSQPQEDTSRQPTSQHRPHSKRHPQPSEHSDKPDSIPGDGTGDMRKYLGVEVRNIDLREEDQNDPSNTQTLLKMPEDSSTSETMSSYDPYRSQTSEDYSGENLTKDCK